MADNVKIIVHRGTHQIGGICTEIRSDKTRLIIDFGDPLEGEGRQEKLDIPGLTAAPANVDAVLFTHNHADHIGDIMRILPDIPLYMEKTAKEISRRYYDRVKNHNDIDVSRLEAIKPLENEKKITIGDFTITPILSDHSAFHSLMFLLECNGKRILYTGDYRLHGSRGAELLAKLQEISPVDLLITDGTTLSRSNGAFLTEAQVKKMFQAVIEAKKYVFLLTSSTNIERIYNFSKSVPTGKYFLTSDFVKEILPLYGDCKALSYGKNIAEKIENRGFGWVITSSGQEIEPLKYYFKNHAEETMLIYSMWRGYSKLPKVAEILKIAGSSMMPIHSSGHVMLEDFEKVVAVTKPDKIIFIHTNADVKSIDIAEKDRVVTLNDGEAFDL